VPVPVEGYATESKRIYVWFDAVIGYLSASLEWAANIGEPDAWRAWWQNDASTHTYFMGKDNIVFHTIIWPSILLGYDQGGQIGAGKGRLHLPDDVVASEFLLLEGAQMSTSRGIGVNLHDVLEAYDADAVRYYLTAAGPETQDSTFSWDEFVRRNNDELLANWGNLVNRTLTNAYRNFGEVPRAGELTGRETAVLAGVAAAFDTVGELIEQCRFKAALAAAMHASTLANQYVSQQAPWSVIKDDRERAGTILNVALRCVDSLKVVFTPFLPFSSQALHRMLGYDDVIAGDLDIRDVEDGGETHAILTGEYSSWRRGWEPTELPEGQPLREPAPLFKKLDPV
jgi:methionyl-tRNA synthetase